jgi:hypothetical protein
MKQFRYLGTTLTNQNSIHEEIRGKLKSGSAYHYLVQNRSSASVLSRNITIKIYRTIILSRVLYGFEAWSVILREEHRQRAFENRVLRRIYGPKRGEVTGKQRKVHIGELCVLYWSPDIIWMIKSRRMRWAGNMPHMGEGRGAVHTGF